MTTIEEDFLTLQLAIWKLKRPCSDDPESAQAIRNGVYMSVAHKVQLIAKQVYAERSGLKKRITELEARECRLLTEEEFARISLNFPCYKAYKVEVQRKFAEVNGLKVKP